MYYILLRLRALKKWKRTVEVVLEVAVTDSVKSKEKKTSGPGC